uniref:Integrase catalytic domain-containing protein n=1 Tax=Heligmosomoides polygyrus TaxID=6339 RepID=A0A183G4W9_HELPZ
PRLHQHARTTFSRSTCVHNSYGKRISSTCDRRSRPFEHIAVDYFGPLHVKRNGETFKFYGITLTCTVTRLAHLELVPDMSTDHVLLALQRLFARRGVPSTIASDNMSNFLLGEKILREAVLLVSEESLNSRPLTYQEERWEETPLLRSIDFIQRDMIITHLFETIGVDDDDASFVPSTEAATIQTSRRCPKNESSPHGALQVYLESSLSNQNGGILYLNSKRETSKQPSKGTVVLISEPVVPRNAWKMGIITELLEVGNNVIREA